MATAKTATSTTGMTTTSRNSLGRGLGSRPSSSAGFSLVELLAVIIVLGMAATLIAVDWRAMLPRTQLNSTIRNIATTISGTRSDSIARNAEFGILYDIEGNRWRIISPFMPTGGLAPEFSQRHAFEWMQCEEGVEIESITLEGQQYTENPTEQGLFVGFDPLGSSSGHTIVLTQPVYENQYTIEVLGLTGLIRMHTGYFTREPAEEQNFEG